MEILDTTTGNLLLNIGDSLDVDGEARIVVEDKLLYLDNHNILKIINHLNKLLEQY